VSQRWRDATAGLPGSEAVGNQSSVNPRVSSMSQVRFTVRSMMMAVAILAIVIGTAAYLARENRRAAISAYRSHALHADTYRKLQSDLLRMTAQESDQGTAALYKYEALLNGKQALGHEQAAQRIRRSYRLKSNDSGP
jgi:hypothetical protein